MSYFQTRVNLGIWVLFAVSFMAFSFGWDFIFWKFSRHILLSTFFDDFIFSLLLASIWNQIYSDLIVSIDFGSVVHL